MGRYTGPIYKKSRHLGFSVLETGKELLKRPYKPGQHGKNIRRGKQSNYKIQLMEKQKLRFTYGVNEKQFKLTFEKASKMRGIHGENFMKLLESRLDNVVYRMGIAKTRRAARQIVNHGHIIVNDRKIDIPSYLAQPGDKISLKEKAKDFVIIKSALEDNIKVPEYVSFDKDKMEGVFIRYPERTELNIDVKESMIVEFYSK